MREHKVVHSTDAHVVDAVLDVIEMLRFRKASALVPECDTGSGACNWLLENIM